MKHNDRPQNHDSTITSEKPLQSWKDIAAYLEISERTARRWEESTALPVRRHGDGKRSSVYAFPSELDEWRLAREPKTSQTILWRWSVPVAIAALSIVLGAWFILYGPVFNPPNPLVEAAEGITLRQVWTGQEVDSTGRPSPDGRYLSCRVGPAGNLGVCALDSGETRLLTHDAGWADYAYYSVFSPQGDRVAYEWGKRETDLRVVDLSGLEPQVLHPREPGWWVEPVDWSRDGRFILVRRHTGDPPHSYQIGMVSVEDGSLSILKTVNCGEEINLWFSPDGNYIVYDSSSGADRAERDISILSVADRDEHPVVEFPGDDYVLGWAPDGRFVLFASNRSGSYGVWLVGVIEGRPEGDPVPVKQNIGRIHSLGFTEDGSLFYEHTGGNPDLDIYTVEVDLEDAQLHGEPHLDVQTHIGNNWNPAWSPEGDYLAYISKQRESKTYALHLRNEKTGEEKQLSPELSRLNQFYWSPDGRFFLVKGESLDGRAGWFICDRITAGVEPIPFPERGGAVFCARWFPDGQRILYGRNNGREGWTEFAELNLTTGREKTLLRLEKDLAGYLAFSPDGTKLAFTRWHVDRGNPKSVSLIMTSLKSGKQIELLSAGFPEAIGGLAWSNDGRFLVYVKTLMGMPGQSNAELWRVKPGQGEPVKMGVLGNLVTRQPIRIHPEDNRIAVSRVQNRAEIWAMEGFLPAEVDSK